MGTEWKQFLFNFVILIKDEALFCRGMVTWNTFTEYTEIEGDYMQK